MDLTVHAVTLVAIIAIFAAYRFARVRAAAGSAGFEWVNSWIRPGAERLFLPFVVAWVVVTGVDYLSGGALSHADRLWVGLAIGLGMGALAVAVMSRRAQQR